MLSRAPWLTRFLSRALSPKHSTPVSLSSPVFQAAKLAVAAADKKALTDGAKAATEAQRKIEREQAAKVAAERKAAEAARAEAERKAAAMAKQMADAKRKVAEMEKQLADLQASAVVACSASVHARPRCLIPSSLSICPISLSLSLSLFLCPSLSARALTRATMQRLC